MGWGLGAFHCSSMGCWLTRSCAGLMQATTAPAELVVLCYSEDTFSTLSQAPLPTEPSCWPILFNVYFSFYINQYVHFKLMLSFPLSRYPVDPALFESLLPLSECFDQSPSFVCQFIHSALCWSLYFSCLHFKCCASFMKCGVAKLYDKGRFLYKPNINVPWSYTAWSMIMNFVTSSSF